MADKRSASDRLDDQADEEMPITHMSDGTKERLAEFENRLYRQALEAKRASLPDTSIHGGGSELDVLEDYYPDEDIPIYGSGLNKQIDRIDMEIDKAKRAQRSAFRDPEAEAYMARIRKAVAEDKDKTDEEKAAEADAHKRKRFRDDPFILIVPLVIIFIAIVFIVLMAAFGR